MTFAADAFFAAGSSVLGGAATDHLRDLATKARGIDLEAILVEGHTDAREAQGVVAASLSARRAEVVKRYLVLQGINADQIFVVGRGESQPIADNRSADGRSKNRRVEIEVIGAFGDAKRIRPGGRIVEILFGTNRALTGKTAPEHFFSDEENDHREDQRLTLGRATVSVPPKHIQRGELEEPGIVRVTLERITKSDVAKVLKIPEFEARDPALHFAFAKPLDLLDGPEFDKALRLSVERARRHEALIYVHGFANSFADAAYRTAQFAYDLTDSDHDIAPLMFSWPSDPSSYNYAGAADRAWSAGRQLARFLDRITDVTGAGVVHIVAHSRGAQVLGFALNQLRSQNLLVLRSDERLVPRFNQIILAAPDIRAADFEGMVLPAVATGHKITNYVSSNDEALIFAKKVNAGARAGDSGAGLVLVRGVNTIDVSAVNVGMVGHSAFAGARSVICDIAAQLVGSLPEQRDLRRVDRQPFYFWKLEAPSPSKTMRTLPSTSCF